MKRNFGAPMRLAALVAGAMLAIPASAQGTAGSTDMAPSAQAPAIARRDTGIDDSGWYAREVQACRAGRTQQDLDTCLEEARNAQADRRHGVLARQGEDFTSNALARCEPLRGDDRVACEARVMGFGSTSGSIAGGGVLREVETVVVPAGTDAVRIRAQTPNPVVIVVPARSR
jgi:hypothetical protein